MSLTPGSITLITISISIITLIIIIITIRQFRKSIFFFSFRISQIHVQNAAQLAFLLPPVGLSMSELSQMGIS